MINLHLGVPPLPVQFKLSSFVIMNPEIEQGIRLASDLNNQDLINNMSCMLDEEIGS